MSCSSAHNHISSPLSESNYVLHRHITGNRYFSKTHHTVITTASLRSVYLSSLSRMCLRAEVHTAGIVCLYRWQLIYTLPVCTYNDRTAILQPYMHTSHYLYTIYIYIYIYTHLSTHRAGAHLSSCDMSQSSIQLYTCTHRTHVLAYANTQLCTTHYGTRKGGLFIWRPSSRSAFLLSFSNSTFSIRAFRSSYWN